MRACLQPCLPSSQCRLELPRPWPRSQCGWLYCRARRGLPPHTPAHAPPRAGKGAFGVVRLVVENSTGRPFACKSISKAKLISKEDVDDVRREVEILNLVSPHPTVAGLKQASARAQGASEGHPARSLGRPPRCRCHCRCRRLKRANTRGLPAGVGPVCQRQPLRLRPTGARVEPLHQVPCTLAAPAATFSPVASPRLPGPPQVYEDRYAVHIVMEVCVGGELFERIVSKGTFSEADAARHFRRMVEMVGAAFCLWRWHCG